MPEKPRRRKKQGANRGLIAAVIIALVLVGGGVYYRYSLTTTSNPTSGCPLPAGSTTSLSSVAISSGASPIYARVCTSMGYFDIELFPASAPKTVTNFVGLVQSGFYNNLCWWRIEPGPPPFVIQTGDPKTTYCGGDRSTWGQSTSGTSLPFEYNPSLHNYAGYLAMASTAPKVGGGSQFFINLSNNTSLDGNYAVFGKVISGMNVVSAIGNVAVEPQPGQQSIHEPVNPVYITRITILTSP